MARAHSSGEPLALGEFDHERRKHILNLSIAEVFADNGQASCGLISDDSLILSRERLEEAEEDSLVVDEGEDVSEFFGNGEENFVVLVFD